MHSEVRQSKVYQVLARPQLIAGVDPKFLGLNIMLTALMLTIHFWYWIIMTYFIHVLMKRVWRKDPLMYKLYLRYSWQGDYYDPWVDPDPRRGLRPMNFGREVLR